MSIAVWIEDNVGHVEEAGGSKSCFETTLDSSLAGRSLGLVVEGHLDLVTSGARGRSGGVAVSTGLLTVSSHVGCVPVAPSVVSPRAAAGLEVGAGGHGRSGIALVARLLAVRKHVSRVVGAFSLGSPLGAVGVVVNAASSYRLDGNSCESGLSKFHII